MTEPTTTEAGSTLPRTRAATVEELLKKRRRETTVEINTSDDAGNDVTLQLRFRAISSKQYDDLVGKHEPTTKQKADGAVYNIDTFAPALIAAVSLEPKLSVEDAEAIYNSDEWSGGEIGGLFLSALRLCNAGLDVPFTGRG